MRVGVPSSQPEFCGRDHLHGRRASAAADVLSALLVFAVVVFFAANPVPQCSRRIAQLLEGMRNSGAMLENVRSTKLATADFWL